MLLPGSHAVINVAEIINRLPKVIPSLIRENLCEMFVLLRTNMQVLLNYNVLIAVDRMRFVPCLYFFQGLENGKSLKLLWL